MGEASRPAGLARIAAVVALLAGCAGDPPPFVAQLPDGELVTAHRGGSALAPENTMAAFDNAVALGVDIIELDVHTSADGELVVIHDRSIDRVTGAGEGCATEQDTEEETFGTLLVHDLTLAELQSHDAGYCFQDPDAAEDAPEEERYPYRGQGVVIPSLRQVLEAHPDQRFVVEIKQHEPSIVEPVTALLEELDAVERTCMLDFDPDGTAALAEAGSADTCLCLSSAGIRCWASEAIMPFGGGGCEDYDLAWFPHESGGYDMKRERLVRNLHGMGYPVLMWTVNDEDLMTEIFDLGVDGVITDHPDLAQQVIDAR